VYLMLWTVNCQRAHTLIEYIITSTTINKEKIKNVLNLKNFFKMKTNEFIIIVCQLLLI